MNDQYRRNIIAKMMEDKVPAPQIMAQYIQSYSPAGGGAFSTYGQPKLDPDPAAALGRYMRTQNPQSLYEPPPPEPPMTQEQQAMWMRNYIRSQR